MFRKKRKIAIFDSPDGFLAISVNEFNFNYSKSYDVLNHDKKEYKIELSVSNVLDGIGVIKKHSITYGSNKSKRDEDYTNLMQILNRKI